ncbi:MAG: protein kinase [Eubacteriales bacterium]|nr:protein kinase [Eubacteriales bacterium]
MTPTMVNGVCSACGQPPLQRTTEDAGLLPAGARLDDGNIIVGNKLGRGGFGVTYIALDTKYNRRIALKEYMPRHMAERDGLALKIGAGKQESYQQSLRSFVREARVINELREHPNIVHVMFVMEENNTAYYGMELLAGEDLGKWLKRNGIQDAKSACQLLNPIMDALAFLHEKGVLHRDLSPENIFLCRDAKRPDCVTPKLIDFGAAYVAMADFTQTYPSVKRKGYSPLEQNWSPKHQGTWTDVYSFCATLYYVLTGKAPIASADRKLQDDPLLPPSALGAKISGEAEKVLMRGLALEPGKRIRDIRTFQQEFCAAVGVKPYFRSSEPQPSEPKPHSSEHTGSVPVKKSGSIIGKRVLAWLVECLIYYGLAVVFGLLSNTPLETICMLGCGFMLVISSLLLISGGASLGMHLLGLRLRSTRQNRLPIGGCLLYSLLYATPWVLVDFLVLSANPQGVTLRERLTGLRVESAAQAAADPEESIDASQSSSVSMSQEASIVTGTAATGVHHSTPIKKAYLLCEKGPLARQRFALRDGTILGRNAKESQIALPSEDKSVSRIHCSFHEENGKWTVQDMQSRNGTFVDDKQLTSGGSKALREGTKIRVSTGVYKFTYQ